MYKLLISIIILSIALNINSCSSNRIVAAQDAKAQSSVKIAMKDGSVKEGIIFRGEKEQLFYVDAATHKTDTLLYSQIKHVERLNKYFDFNGYEMPRAEIKANKGLKKTLLYGGGGLILGAAAGTGAAIALFAKESNTTAARITIGVAGLAGAYLFGSKGATVDSQDAVFKTRKARYVIEKKEMDKKKKELEQLKREKGLK